MLGMLSWEEIWGSGKVLLPLELPASVQEAIHPILI